MRKSNTLEGLEKWLANKPFYNPKLAQSWFVSFSMSPKNVSLQNWNTFGCITISGVPSKYQFS